MIAAAPQDGAVDPFFRVGHAADTERRRRRRMIAAHPDLRALIGPSPRSALLVVALVAAQFWLAWLLCDSGMALVAVAAFCPGAWIAAALTAMIHEAAHGLIFGRARRDRLAALAANLALVTPSAMGFFHYHKWHHVAVGDYAMDVGIPTQGEAAWVRNVAWRKAVWLAAFPWFQWRRTAKFQSRERFWDHWMIANLAVQLATVALILGLWGWRPLAFLLLSYGFSVGFHPLGTRVIQEHFVVADGEETNNHVGWASVLECNFGHHAEHHDLPRVAWHRLPQVSRIAPEFYHTTPVFRSRAMLLVRFLSDPGFDLRNHAVRREPF